MNEFFDNFYLYGWTFFYKFTLTLLRILQPKVLELDDISEVIDMVKTPMLLRNFEKHEGTSPNDLGQISEEGLPLAGRLSGGDLVVTDQRQSLE